MTARLRSGILRRGVGSVQLEVHDVREAVHLVAEPPVPATDRSGQVVWITGPKQVQFAASRVRIVDHSRHHIGTMKLSRIGDLLSTRARQITAAARVVRGCTRTPTIGFQLAVALEQMRKASWSAPTRNFAFDLAWGVMPSGLAVVGAVDNRCPHCGSARDSIGHFVIRRVKG